MIINVNLPEKSYGITVERGALNNAAGILHLDRKVLIVTDSGVPEKYSQTVASQCKHPVIVCVEQGEGSKSIAVFEQLCQTMLENNFARTDCVVAVGGGVVGDLSGFAAASYMRGIDFYNIPTTLLSQVDSSIGGKVAVNFGGVKNIIGAFYQPKAVLIDPDTLDTLSERHYANGLAEGVKMAVCFDEKLFELFENEDIKENIEQIIVGSLNIKKNVVEQDEKETGLRKVLNFGHTLGHAIESAEELGGLYHGECVALGMLPMCSEEVRVRLRAVLEKLNLPICYKGDCDLMMRAALHDKKFADAKVSVVKSEKIGEFSFEKWDINKLKQTLEENYS